jgi:Fe-S cluster biosynthesis and repair protein YggX
MNQLHEQIERFQKMATDDPDNELGHYRLGQSLLENKQYAEAIQSFRRTLELEPMFSKVYQLLAQAQLSAGARGDAVETLRKGFGVADERGDRMPRDEMSRMLTELGEPAPTPKQATSAPAAGGAFRCGKPGCPFTPNARQLPAPPMKDDVGRRIYESVCADCWHDWLKNYSIKVINELRLDLSTERGQEEYDKYMREFLGLE